MIKKNFEIICVTRRSVEIPKVEVMVGKLDDAEFMESKIKRVNVVIHCAALTRSRDVSELKKSNEDVCSNLVNILKKYPDIGLIHLSSDQAEQQTGLYGKSKRNCEQIIENGHLQKFVILRLSAVMGDYRPDLGNTFSKIIRFMKIFRFLLLLGSKPILINPVFIDDISRLICMICKEDRFPNQVLGFPGRTVSLQELIQKFEDRLGYKVVKIAIPLGPIQGICRFLQHFSIFKYLPLDAVIDFGKPLGVDYKDLEKEFNFSPIEVDRSVLNIKNWPN
jgi:nucleoside-diphosphate-sugar epimerase